jgi:hypothetical protein
MATKLLKPTQEFFPQTEKQEGGTARNLEH